MKVLSRRPRTADGRPLGGPVTKFLRLCPTQCDESGAGHPRAESHCRHRRPSTFNRHGLDCFRMGNPGWGLAGIPAEGHISRKTRLFAARKRRRAVGIPGAVRGPAATSLTRGRAASRTPTGLAVWRAGRVSGDRAVRVHSDAVHWIVLVVSRFPAVEVGVRHGCPRGGSRFRPPASSGRRDRARSSDSAADSCRCGRGVAIHRWLEPSCLRSQRRRRPMRLGLSACGTCMHRESVRSVDSLRRSVFGRRSQCDREVGRSWLGLRRGRAVRTAGLCCRGGTRRQPGEVWNSTSGCT